MKTEPTPTRHISEIRSIGDEIYFVDTWRMLVRQKYVIGATLLFALVCAIAYLFFAKSEWEATAVVQVGQVGQVPPDHPQPIETTARIVDRLKLTPLFQNQVLNSLGVSPESSDGKFYRRNINVDLRPNSDLIQIKVRGYTVSSAKNIALAMTDHLKDIHRKLAEPRIASLQAEAKAIDGQLQQALNQQRTTMQSASLGLKGSGSDIGENALLASVAGSSENYVVRDLQRNKLEVDRQLGPNNTYPTALLQDVSVSSSPVFPSTTLVLVMAALLGLIIGALLGCTFDYIERHRLTLES